MKRPSVSPPLLISAVAIALSLTPSAPQTAGADAWTRVFINGRVAPVYFNDGDSFRVMGGELSGTQCRLGGYNTLEVTNDAKFTAAGTKVEFASFG